MEVEEKNVLDGMCRTIGSVWEEVLEWVMSECGCVRCDGSAVAVLCCTWLSSLSLLSGPVLSGTGLTILQRTRRAM